MLLLLLLLLLSGGPVATAAAAASRRRNSAIGQSAGCAGLSLAQTERWSNQSRNSAASGARPVNRPGILVVTSGRWLTAAASQGRLAALAPDSDRLAVCAVNPRPLAV